MKTRFAIFLCLLIPVSAFSQCAGAFGNSPASLTEACSVTGAAIYVVTPAYVNDSTFTISGLWDEPTLLCTAHVDCGTMTFTIDSTQHPTMSFHFRGNGNLNGNTVNVSYAVGLSGSTDTIDFCAATYTGFSVGALSAVPLNLRLWPNPSKDFVELAVGGASSFNASLYSLNGQRLSRFEVQGSECEIPLQGLEAATYLLLIQSEDGRVATRRIVKQ